MLSKFPKYNKHKPTSIVVTEPENSIPLSGTNKFRNHRHKSELSMNPEPPVMPQ